MMGRTTVQRATPRTQRVLLLVWDGMRPDYVTEALTPNLWAFATRGAWYRRAVGIFPSVTRPTTASVSTGAYPGAHGLIANRFVGPPGDRTPVDTGDRMALERLRSLNAGRILPAPTLVERLVATGKRVVVLGSGTTGQATLLDPERVGTTIHVAFTWPEPLLARLAERFGPPPLKRVPVQAANDWLTQVLIEYVLPELAPDVVLMWLCEPDSTQHARGLGAPETLAATRGNDARLGRVLAAVAASGVPTTVIVASDHGHSTVTGMIQEADLLRAAGFADALDRGELLLGEQAIVIPAGPDARELRERVGVWLAAQAWVGALVAWPDDGTRLPGGALTPADLWNGRTSAALAYAPAFTYSYAWTDDTNPHGAPGSAYAPFTAALADFARLQGPVIGLNRLTSTHGTLGSHDQRTLLALGGAGVRAGALNVPAGVIDLAPTILALLGLPPLPNADGRALTEALVDGPDPAAIAVLTETIATLPNGPLRRHWVGTTAYLDSSV
jgi:phosphonoacetate hydrolase